MSDLTIAQTILAQLGGARFTAMTGARDFVGSANALIFALPGRIAARGINKVRVTLEPSDLYTVEFLRMTRRGLEVETIDASEGVYADQLAQVFTKATGLVTSL